MDNRSNRSETGCGTIQELIVWSPGERLAEDERRRVAEHTSGCSECADLWRFAQDLKERAVTTGALHPDAESLVLLSENSDLLSEERRAALRDHLETCSECSNKMEILQEVDSYEIADDHRAGQTVSHGAAAGDRGEPGQSGTFLALLWDKLSAGLLRPAPAALYLAVAVVAVIALLSGRGPAPPEMIENGSLPPVSILADETGTLRDVDSRERAVVAVDGSQSQFLLLELMNLREQPADDELFSVIVTRDGGEDPVMTATTEGRAIRDTYTIGLTVEANALRPGLHTVAVLDSDGTEVFRSHLTVE